MDDMSQHAPAGWLEALERSEAQLAAGQVVSGDEVIRKLHASIARVEARQADKPQRRTVPQR